MSTTAAANALEPRAAVGGMSTPRADSAARRCLPTPKSSTTLNFPAVRKKESIKKKYRKNLIPLPTSGPPTPQVSPLSSQKSHGCPQDSWPPGGAASGQKDCGGEGRRGREKKLTSFPVGMPTPCPAILFAGPPRGTSSSTCEETANGRSPIYVAAVHGCEGCGGRRVGQ